MTSVEQAVTSETTYSADEMMTVSAARALRDGMTCFVGIGLPSAAANLARATHAPSLVLIYESGTLGAKPDRLPLSIGDGMLAETADAVVSVPEIFNYWLQPGRIDVGFLGAAQIDKFGNINTTIVGGDYRHPTVRLPGAGGAPEIAASCREVIVVVRQSHRSFVERMDFITSVGYGSGPGDRERLGLTGAGPKKIITDLGVLEPDPETLEFTMTGFYPGVSAAAAKERTGWDLAIAADPEIIAAPTPAELSALRAFGGKQSKEPSRPPLTYSTPWPHRRPAAWSCRPTSARRRACTRRWTSRDTARPRSATRSSRWSCSRTG
jgi:glutaconate CoA-transferase subunit B